MAKLNNMYEMIAYGYISWVIFFMLIDSDKREAIERWFTGKGYKSFNEYVCALIDEDMKRD